MAVWPVSLYTCVCSNEAHSFGWVNLSPQAPGFVGPGLLHFWGQATYSSIIFLTALSTLIRVQQEQGLIWP